MMERSDYDGKVIILLHLTTASKSHGWSSGRRRSFLAERSVSDDRHFAKLQGVATYTPRVKNTKPTLS